MEINLRGTVAKVKPIDKEKIAAPLQKWLYSFFPQEVIVYLIEKKDGSFVIVIEC